MRLSISLTLANRSRDLRAPISRSCHSLPGSSSILVLAFVRAKESNLNRYRRKRISPISNIIDSKKKNIIVGSLLFTMYKCCNAHDPKACLYSLVRGEKRGEKTLDLEVNNIVASNNVAAMLKSHVSRLPPSPIGLSSPLPLLARVSLTGEPFRVYIGASRVSRLTNYVHTSAVA